MSGRRGVSGGSHWKSLRLIFGRHIFVYVYSLHSDNLHNMTSPKLLLGPALWMLVVMTFVTASNAAIGSVDSPEGVNLAAGCPVSFCPLPPRSGKRGQDAAMLLTDGLLVDRPDNHIWQDKGSVNWESVPCAALQLDLGKVSPVSKVAFRLVGGSPQPGIDFPVFVKLLASEDGNDWYQIDKYDSHRAGDDFRFGVPATQGKAWVHELCFDKLAIRARFIGLEIGGTAFTSADELRVMSGDPALEPIVLPPDARVDGPPVPDRQPRIVPLREMATVSVDLALPQPILLYDESNTAREATLSVRVPPGLSLQGVDVNALTLTARTVTRDADGHTVFKFDCVLSGTSMIPWGCLWVRADAIPQDAERAISVTIDAGNGTPRVTSLRYRVQQFAPAPRCKRLMFTLGWWRFGRTMRWPDGIAAARYIGINTLSTMENEVGPNDTGTQEKLAAAKRAGFFVQNIDSPFNRMMANYPTELELRCQSAGGVPLSATMCPSYRGPRYQQELQRIAISIALCQPDFFSADIELWDWRGAIAVEQCVRCGANKRDSGIPSWDQWRLSKGEEMWRDLEARVQSSAQATMGRRVSMGAYDFRPDTNYQGIWPFDRLFTNGLLHGPETSIYTSLRPYDLRLLGDSARADRLAMPKSCGLPWMTPGDAGLLDAEDFRCAMLELLMAGSIGINFWSDRYWDGEVLLGYNQAVRAVSAAEDAIVSGKPFNALTTTAPVRTLAMSNDSVIAILVADYESLSPQALTINLDLPWKCEASESERGSKLGVLAAGRCSLEVPLNGHRSAIAILKRLP